MRDQRNSYPSPRTFARQGRWYERDMTNRKASRARLRPFRIDDAADICRIYPMFFVDNAIHIGSGRLTVAEVGGRVAQGLRTKPRLGQEFT